MMRMAPVFELLRSFWDLREVPTLPTVALISWVFLATVVSEASPRLDLVGTNIQRTA